ncbi:uncharacterized protein M421DRAFT_88203 [Didymella exigua CBS 183.55]|uniref:Uncharacterized protein n=1 Tax=Didymella exigua CBS 183.55 TaxID=1150837 RepID=A0A6A5S249_9PLEO|nr:uncharacterized protein M421DRAFT_88203 [Didymella exigua CBS 183.55]KAF1934192.1 hypothetical protein M421DRAFT_88203 [Didymella exigua CBS 183.55]
MEQTCQTHHSWCRALDEQRQQNYFPSRILDVGTIQSGEIRLIITEIEPPDQDHRCTALSHCLGNNPSSIQLTTENATLLNSDIPPACLSQSFLDAVEPVVHKIA